MIPVSESETVPQGLKPWFFWEKAVRAKARTLHGLKPVPFTAKACTLHG